jgi:hypothetical protein
MRLMTSGQATSSWRASQAARSLARAGYSTSAVHKNIPSHFCERASITSVAAAVQSLASCPTAGPHLAQEFNVRAATHAMCVLQLQQQAAVRARERDRTSALRRAGRRAAHQSAGRSTEGGMRPRVCSNSFDSREENGIRCARRHGQADARCGRGIAPAKPPTSRLGPAGPVARTSSASGRWLTDERRTLRTRRASAPSAWT